MRAVRPATLCAAVLGVMATLVVPAGPAFADDVRDDQWWVKTLDLEAVHKVTQGEGITVAVVDTGVDANHPDLKGNVLPGTDFFDKKSKGHQDRDGHGTGMASLIAGHGHGPGNRDGIIGIAPKAKILPVTVQAKNKVIPPKALAAGIYWAIDHGADVINVSLSSSNDDDLTSAVERAFDKNITVVAGVGNRKDLLIGAPANLGAAIAVTGINKKGGLSKENISAEQTDIAAPGEDIVQALPNGRYADTTGSSSATAIVSGAAALIRAQQPKLSSFDFYKQLMLTTREAGKPGNDDDYGWGILDLKKAVTGKPDARADVKPSPSVSLRPWYGQDEGDGESIQTIVIVVAVWVAFLSIIGTLIFLLVRRIRRRRRAKRAAKTAAVPVGAAVGDNPQMPGAPQSAQDDSVWRPPSGGGTTP